jgi:hypothetical protein
MTSNYDGRALSGNQPSAQHKDDAGSAGRADIRFATLPGSGPSEKTARRIEGFESRV